MRSGLQKQVLLLYKDFLKIIPLKEPEAQDKFRMYIMSEFKKNQQIPKNDYDAIEFLLRYFYSPYTRQGRKKLEIFKDKSCTSIS